MKKCGLIALNSTANWYNWIFLSNFSVPFPLLETELLKRGDDHLERDVLHLPPDEDEAVHQGLHQRGVGGQVVAAHPGAGHGVDQPGEARLQEVGDGHPRGEEAGEHPAGHLGTGWCGYDGLPVNLVTL